MNDKKIPKIITTLVICGGLIMGFNTLKTPVYASDDAQTVITNDENGIPDKVLYDALLEKLDSNNDGVLTKEEADEGVYFLSIKEKNITSLKGIDKINVTNTLVLDNDNITDISPLTQMNGLEILELCGNNISDISVLKI